MLQSGKGDSDSKKTATADKPKNKNIFKDPEVPGCSRQPAQRLNRLNNDKQIVNHRVLSCHRCLWMLVSFEIFGGHPRVWRLPTKQLSNLRVFYRPIWEEVGTPICRWWRTTGRWSPFFSATQMGPILQALGWWAWSCRQSNVRRKFRSQTSDNMDRWKAERGRVREKRRVEERRWLDRRERVRRKKMQMREKVGKSRKTVFFQWFEAPENRKVGSLKRRVRSHVARWAMEKCMPLWREAHFQVKIYKAHHARTTLRSWDVVSRGRRKGWGTFSKWAKREGFVSFPKTMAGVGHLKRICKDAFSVAGAVRDIFIGAVRRSGRWFPERGCILEHQIFRFAEMSLRGRRGAMCIAKGSDVCPGVPWVSASFAWRGTMCSAKGSDVRPGVPWVSASFAWQAWGNVRCQGVGCMPWRPLGLRLFCVAGVGQCALPRGRMYALASLGSPPLLRGRRGTMCVAKGSDVRLGVPWVSASFAWQAWDNVHCQGVGCTPSYDLASLFRGRRSTFDRWTGKVAKRIGTKLLALHSTFHFWRKPRRIALFLMLSSSKIEEVSQNCFVLDVVQFK